MLMTTGAERLVAEFSKRDLSTEEGRATAVIETEARLSGMVQTARRWRLITGWTYVASGGLLAATGVVGLSISANAFRQQPGPGTAPGAIYWQTGIAAVGLGMLGFGIFEVTARRTQFEQLWELYQSDDPAGAKLQSKAVTLTPTFGAGGNGVQLGLAGNF
jgi:hypothetical protein